MAHLKLIKDGIWQVTKDIDLNYSPDENGFYFQNFALEQRVTKLYDTADEAMDDYENNKLIWF